MKKILAVFMAVLMLCGCQAKNEKSNIKHSGVWLTYSEIDSMLDGDFKAEFDLLIENCQNLQINNLYIHVRAFGDALYKSALFPQNAKSLKYDYDILQYVIERCHKTGISVHAWINPYRISTTTQNIEEISHDSPVYLWLNDQNTENDKNVCILNGIYLNPAEKQVQQLIIDGVKEIVNGYAIDGIHFDDYFYPTQNAEFDKLSYEAYITESESPLELADFRRLNVDALLSGVYNAIKHINDDVVFSISPAASLKNNYESLYADVESWIDNGFIDAIIPQLYFGFDYPDGDYKFQNLLKEWQNVSLVNPNIKLYIGLAFYKSKPNLSADISEWQQNGDIIKRQVEIIDKTADLDGYVYFSYSSLVSDEYEFKIQRQNLSEYLRKRK